MPVIVESWSLYNLILVAHLVLYIGAPIWLFKQGWPILGGVVMVGSTILPIAGQTWFTDSESPAFGLLIMVELPFALIVLLVGTGISLARWIGEWRHAKGSR
ncbi:MAG TPA: hypothetical protein VF463_01870 [Sphingobium sp.]